MSERNDCSMLVFTLNGQRFALPYTIIVRVIRVVDITPLPNVPNSILGVINLHGKIIPTIDIRVFLGLTKIPINIRDYIIIITVQNKLLSFVAEDVVFDVFKSSDISSTELSFNQTCDIKQIEAFQSIKDSSGVIYILNIEKLLENDPSINIPSEAVENIGDGKNEMV